MKTENNRHKNLRSRIGEILDEYVSSGQLESDLKNISSAERINFIGTILELRVPRQESVSLSVDKFPTIERRLSREEALSILNG